MQFIHVTNAYGGAPTAISIARISAIEQGTLHDPKAARIRADGNTYACTESYERVLEMIREAGDPRRAVK